jgi:hypothetical protein
VKSIKPIRICSAIIVALAISVGAAGAQSVTTTDIQRLQDAIYDTSRDLSQARGRDATLSAQLEEDLDELSDEVASLRVRLRKNETVSQREYGDLRDRIEQVRARARGETPGRSTPQTGTRDTAPRAGTSRSSSSTRNGVIPVGTEFDVRLQNPLSSATAQVEDHFEGTTLVDLYSDDRVLVPAGSVMRGIVSSVTKAGRVERKGSLTVAFDEVTVRGRVYPLRATVTQALESEGIRGEAGRIGAGAGVGAIIGGILGGFKGALAGILIGGGGTIAATEGEDATLPAGTVLRVRLDSPLELR